MSLFAPSQHPATPFVPSAGMHSCRAPLGVCDGTGTRPFSGHSKAVGGEYGPCGREALGCCGCGAVVQNGACHPQLRYWRDRSCVDPRRDANARSEAPAQRVGAPGRDRTAELEIGGRDFLRAREALPFQAAHDSLTGLWSRSAILTNWLARSNARGANAPCSASSSGIWITSK